MLKGNLEIEKPINKIVKWIDEMRMYNGEVIVNISMAELRELRDNLK